MRNKTLIAILEDDFNLAALIKSTLIYFGYEAVTYSSARRFMADLNKHAPALCIIDLVLPDVCGCARPCGSQLPVVVPLGRRRRAGGEGAGTRV